MASGSSQTRTEDQAKEFRSLGVWRKDADILGFLQHALCIDSLAETVHVVVMRAVNTLTVAELHALRWAKQKHKREE